MNPSVKRILTGAAALLLFGFIVLAVVFFIPRDNTSFSFECFRLRMTVSGFLKDLEKERYEDAFRSVYCFGEDGAPIASDETVEKLWVDRVSQLRNSTSNTYLADFSDLTVRKVDGQMQVSVLLTVQRQGAKDPFYSEGSVITVVYDDGWKIQSLSSQPAELQTPFEKAVSGLVCEGELEGQES